MTPQELERRTSEARNLRDNETLQQALATMRANALEALAITPVTDIEALRHHQATVRSIDQFYFALEQMILSGPRPQLAVA